MLAYPWALHSKGCGSTPGRFTASHARADATAASYSDVSQNTTVVIEETYFD